MFEFLIVVAVISFITNAIKKANEAQNTQKGKQAPGQFNQRQRPNVRNAQRQYTLRELINQATNQGTSERMDTKERRYNESEHMASHDSFSQRAASEGQQTTGSLEESEKVLERFANIDYDLNINQSQLELEVDDEVQTSVDLEITEENILKGIIFSEILGPPKSRRN